MLTGDELISVDGHRAASALTRLYLEKREELLRFFTARTGSAAAAEDLVQELYFKVLAAPDGDLDFPPGYLYRLGLNLMVDRYRAEERGRRRERDYADSAVPRLAANDAPPHERAVIAREEIAAMLEAIERLPPQCRRVFRMHRLEGMSHGEIAEALGISRAAVEKHMTTALKRLAQVMK